MQQSLHCQRRFGVTRIGCQVIKFVRIVIVVVKLGAFASAIPLGITPTIIAH